MGVSATRQKTNVGSIDALKDLIQLRVLILDHTKGTNIGALKVLTALHTLELSHPPVQDVEILKGLTGLKMLVPNDTNVWNTDEFKAALPNAVVRFLT